MSFPASVQCNIGKPIHARLQEQTVHCISAPIDIFSILTYPACVGIGCVCLQCSADGKRRGSADEEGVLENDGEEVIIGI